MGEHTDGKEDLKEMQGIPNKQAYSPFLMQCCFDSQAIPGQLQYQNTM